MEGRNYTDLDNVNCDLCESDNYTVLFQGRDYRFGGKAKYNVVKCNICGLIYINPRPSTKSILELYEKDYTPKNSLRVLPKVETSIWKIVLKKAWYRINGQYICEIIKETKGKILDVGCGNGHLLLPLKQKGCEVFGVETNPNSLNVCNKLGLKVFYGTLKDAKFPDDYFDTIIISQVLEHLPSPKMNLKEVFRILKLNGKVFIYLPNFESYISKVFGKYWHGWHIPFHFYAFTKDTIKKLAIETGFDHVQISTVTPDNFFTVSLKDCLFGETKDVVRPVERGKFFDSLMFRIIISPVLRLLDFLTKNGDCLKVVLTKQL